MKYKSKVYKSFGAVYYYSEIKNKWACKYEYSYYENVAEVLLKKVNLRRKITLEKENTKKINIKDLNGLSDYAKKICNKIKNSDDLTIRDSNGLEYTIDSSDININQFSEFMISRYGDDALDQ